MSATTIDNTEPDTVGDAIIVNCEKTHRGDFRVYFNGFSVVSLVDRYLPIHDTDETIVLDENEVRARGVVVESRRDEHSTEFAAVPAVEGMEVTHEY